jgi:galactoside O-acetyltransferase
MTQRERIANGLLFTDITEGLPEDRLRGKEYVYVYEYKDTRPTEVLARMDIARRMFGAVGKVFWTEPPIQFAYGSNIFIGRTFMQMLVLLLLTI